MIDHIGIAVADFGAARHFYDAALGAIGMDVVMEVSPEETGGDYHGVGYGSGGKPWFWIGSGGPPSGAGIHIAFTAEHRAQVDAFYAAAMGAGGRDNGAPGIRAHYHPNYYGAFVFDPAGNNVEAVCHKPE